MDDQTPDRTEPEAQDGMPDDLRPKVDQVVRYGAAVAAIVGVLFLLVNSFGATRAWASGISLAAVVLVGSFILWLIWDRDRERRRRKELEQDIAKIKKAIEPAVERVHEALLTRAIKETGAQLTALIGTELGAARTDFEAAKAAVAGAAAEQAAILINGAKVWLAQQVADVSKRHADDKESLERRLKNLTGRVDQLDDHTHPRLDILDNECRVLRVVVDDLVRRAGGDEIVPRLKPDRVKDGDDLVQWLISSAEKGVRDPVRHQMGLLLDKSRANME